MAPPSSVNTRRRKMAVVHTTRKNKLRVSMFCSSSPSRVPSQLFFALPVCLCISCVLLVCSHASPWHSEYRAHHRSSTLHRPGAPPPLVEQPVTYFWKTIIRGPVERHLSLRSRTRIQPRGRPRFSIRSLIFLFVFFSFRFARVQNQVPRFIQTTPPSHLCLTSP